MNNDEILERNKQIVMMLGLKRGWWIHQEKPLTNNKRQWCDLGGKTFLGSKAYYDKQLMFHYDWNWLMEAVKFIEEQTVDSKYASDYNVLISMFGCLIETTGYHQKTIVEINNSNKIEAVFIAVSDFAKSFNRERTNESKTRSPK